MSDDTTGFAAYSLYHSLHLHFTSSSYDYIKYNGKTNVSKDSFSKRKDKYHFYRLSRKYSLESLKDYFIANLIEMNVRWIGDISSDTGEDNYKKWQKRVQSLTYTWENDIIHIMEQADNPNELLRVEKGQHPRLLKEVMTKGIALETFCILNDLMKFFPMWSEKINETIIWPDFKRKCEKYLPFIQYDNKKFKTILKEHLNATA